MAQTMCFALTTDEEGVPDAANMHECWSICERLWAADLYIEHVMSSSGCEVLVSVGMPHKLLIEEVCTAPGMRHRSPRAC